MALHPLEKSVMIGIRALTLFVREQLGAEATPRAVASRYLAYREKAIESLRANPNPSEDECVATEMILEEMKAAIRNPATPPTPEKAH